jgi:hypothetical protein
LGRHKKKIYIGVPSKKQKLKITSSQPRKLIFGIQPYLTQLDEILKNNTNWDAIKKIIRSHQKKKKKKKISLPVNLGS